MLAEQNQGFDIVEELLGFMLLGTEWILWLLLFLSVLSVAITFERIWYFWNQRVDFEEMKKELLGYLEKKDFEAATNFCKNSHIFEAQVALQGLEQREQTALVREGVMDGRAVQGRQEFDKGLMVLGTLGNNAPFIGLFGTVIGIIAAFNDLAANPEGGPSVVMAGISEALVATAIGLMVAIPAVIAFNIFNKMIKRRMANAAVISKQVAVWLT
ncbi:MAG: MotA/TolQ/ExbB proton channel family protein [Oligoflexales bacterium]